MRTIGSLPKRCRARPRRGRRRRRPWSRAAAPPSAGTWLLGSAIPWIPWIRRI